MCSSRGRVSHLFFEHVSTRGYRSQERSFVDNVFFLSIAPLAFAMMETLRTPEQWDVQRGILAERIQIIRAGALAPAISE